jgi:diguanylate cyclase (GGDEF)-like protein
MDGGDVRDAALVGAGALGRLMPMYLWVTPTGLIRAAGPTLTKLCGAAPLTGGRFLDRFRVDRPRPIESMADVEALAGQRLLLTLRDRTETGLRGQALPLGAGQGWLLNLSFGISVAEAVRDHRLTNADFAPTDLTVELLYLTEVKAAVMGELRGLNARLQAAHEAAEARALTDPLTGLANRRALEAELARDCALAARGGAGFALMHLDLDFFKNVNDTFGHAAGDHVLAEAARRLRAETRAADTVARVGGDEFVLILRGESDAGQAAGVAARIIAALERPIAFEGRDCRISGSVGLVMSDRYAAPEPERMQADADEATYAAKRGGRGRCVVG